MIQKKVCMLGGFAVGKTSLVSRYVQSIFSDKYHTTVGVKVDKKVVKVGDADVTLVIWDLAGEDGLQEMNTSYLRGAAGYLLVCDGTRCTTFDQAVSLQTTLARKVGDVPFVFMVNKHDLSDQWTIAEADLKGLEQRGWTVVKTSAKAAANVDESFTHLAAQMLLSDRQRTARAIDRGRR